MLSTKDLIVISDLHLATERGKGLFRADDELADFLLWVYENTKNSFLVLNGDIFDFLVSENGSKTISINEADLKMKRIIEYHPEVFDALSKLANSSSHQIYFLSGNHDPELANPIAQSIIENRLRGDNFTPNIRWVTGGHALLTQVGDSKVLIEHGDLFDDFNRVDYGELHRSTAHLSRMLGFNEYKPPAGSGLVETLSSLRQRYNWIDYIKPLSTGTLPLLCAFAKKDLNSQDLNIFRRLLFNGKDVASSWLMRQLKDFIIASPFLGNEDTELELDGRQLFNEWLESERRQPITLSEKEVIDLIQRLKKVSEQDTTFSVEAPESNKLKTKYLKEYAKEKQVSAVIHGHTHSVKSYTIQNSDVLGLSSELLYLNSGTWGHLLQLPQKQDSDEKWMSFLADLETNSDNSFNRLTFVRITQDKKTQASVSEWVLNENKQRTVKELSVRNLESNIWKKEE